MNFLKTTSAITAVLLVMLAIGSCDSTGKDSTLDGPRHDDQLSGHDVAPESEQNTGKIAYGRFVPEREDDFTWENDKVAFRVYGPSSPAEGPVSGVDAWFKKVEYSIIDKWYAGFLAGKTYHEDYGEGYDPYHTGTSRGVGGTAIWIDGVAWPAATYNSFEVLNSGGDIVEFTLQYEWETPLGLVSESKTISLALGDQLYKVSSVFSLNNEPTALPVAIGLTTHDEAAQVTSNAERGRISTWEIIDDMGVGTGVLMAPDRTREIIHTPSEEKDASHIWLITASDENGELSYSAGFAWQAARQITTIKQWNEYLDSNGNE